MENNYNLILAIVNKGYSEIVMDSARKKGATGGTILNAKGTVAEKAQTILGISVQPEKEIVLILTDKEIRNEIMTSIVESAGLNTLGRGIVFSLPVDNVLGLKDYQALVINEKNDVDSHQDKPVIND